MLSVQTEKQKPLVRFQIADILSSCGGRMSASEHSDYGYFEKRLQKIFSDETGTFDRVLFSPCFLWSQLFRLIVTVQS